MQNPAAAQSLVGIKTTYGIVPTGGLAPLAGSTRDVLGPNAKTARDAGLALDSMTGYDTPDFVGTAPEGGYTGYFGDVTLDGKTIGLFGRGWRDTPLSAEVSALYDAAVSQLEGLGANVVQDPFAGTGFNVIRGASGVAGIDPRGIESIGNDFYNYLQDGLGIPSFDAFVAKVCAHMPCNHRMLVLLGALPRGQIASSQSWSHEHRAAHVVCWC